MVIKKLKHGDSVAGLLVDGLAQTPYVGATLTYDEKSGIKIEIPHMYDAKEFSHVRDWFADEQASLNFQFITRDGIMSLYGCRYAGHVMSYGTGFSITSIRPQEVVSGIREGDMQAPLKMKEFSSEIDELLKWTRFKAIKHETGVNKEGRIHNVNISAESVESASWTQGDARMEMRTGWSTGPNTSGFSVSEWVTLDSSFNEPRPLSSHLREHRKVASLLKFLFGKQVAFRRHQLRDDRFFEHDLAGDARKQLPRIEIITRRTFKESSSPKLNQKSSFPIAHLTEIGTEGLENWSNAYDGWGRFILPAASALSRQGKALEDNVLSYSMSLEAAGSLIGQVEGEESTLHRGRATTSTYSYRCIASLGIEWNDIAASPTGLARALSNNYNTIKHYDRGEFPDFTETYLVNEVLKMTTRLIALRITNPNEGLLKRAGQHLLPEVQQAFRQQTLHINESGEFTVSDADD